MSSNRAASTGRPAPAGQQATAEPAEPIRLDDVTEQKRLNDAREAGIPWKKWGPYLCERQWGTVREDYSQDGNAWDYFSHDQSRSRAYRWGEDGLGGISDDKQRLCFALALWNGRDPILKERLFGLTNSEGNHGEDVKEYYFYLDSTPTHSYMKYLYKYPQREFPYRDLVETNRRRSRRRVRVRAARHRRLRRRPLLRRLPRVREGRSGGHPDPDHGPQPRARGGPAPPAADALVPQHLVVGKRASRSRSLREADGAIRASHPELGDYTLSCDGRARAALHREREQRRTASGASRTPRPGSRTRSTSTSSPATPTAVNPAKTGTKAAARYVLDVPAGGASVVRLRLSAAAAGRAVRRGLRRDVRRARSPTPTSSTTGSRRAR